MCKDIEGVINGLLSNIFNKKVSVSNYERISFILFSNSIFPNKYIYLLTFVLYYYNFGIYNILVLFILFSLFFRSLRTILFYCSIYFNNNICIFLKKQFSCFSYPQPMSLAITNLFSTSMNLFFVLFLF